MQKAKLETELKREGNGQNSKAPGYLNRPDLWTHEDSDKFLRWKCSSDVLVRLKAIGLIQNDHETKNRAKRGQGKNKNDEHKNAKHKGERMIWILEDKRR